MSEESKFDLTPYLFITAIVLAVAVIVLPAVTVQKWVGSTSLEIVVSVNDASSGDPVPNADLIVTDADSGDVLHRQTASSGRFTVVTERTVAGSRGFREDTAFVNLPNWLLQATARGYAEHDPVLIATMPQPREQWVLRVPIELSKQTVQISTE